MDELLLEPSAYLFDWTAGSVVLRFLTAMFAGGLIGVDRGIKRRGAGLRTHMLVCLSSTLVMITGQYIYMNFPGNMDMARLGAQVISGVGFLGVGTIIVTGWNKVRGVTTAASIWSCACLGLAIGVGFLFAGVLACVLMVVVLHFMESLDRYICKRSKYYDFMVDVGSTQEILNLIKSLQRQDIIVNSFEEKTAKNQAGGRIPVILSLTVKDKEKRGRIRDILLEVDGVCGVKEI